MMERIARRYRSCVSLNVAQNRTWGAKNSALALTLKFAFLRLHYRELTYFINFAIRHKSETFCSDQRNKFWQTRK
jgi:hypothetical protein